MGESAESDTRSRSSRFNADEERSYCQRYTSCRLSQLFGSHRGHLSLAGTPVPPQKMKGLTVWAYIGLAVGLLLLINVLVLVVLLSAEHFRDDNESDIR
jgi:hypothetical protein